MKKIIILGGEGDGANLASIIKTMQLSGEKVIPYGFLNDFLDKGSEIDSIPVLDSIANAHKFFKDPQIFFIAALLKVKESYQRANKIESLKIPPEKYYTLIHPSAYIPENVEIGFGTFIGPNVSIMSNTIIGNHCSLRASASIGHDCNIGNHCYMGPNSTISGRVKLGEGSHVGPNASVLERVEIGNFSVVGIGSAVIKDIPPFKIVFGCPAKIFSKIDKVIE